jgi:hypothetical protein
MSKNILYGNEEQKNRLSKRNPEDKNVYINFDAINELPDEYDVVVSEVLFNPLKLAESFSPVGGGSYMPQPNLMYEIADACGISGVGVPMSEAIIEEVDINPMLIKSLIEEPTFRKMIVGRRVTKVSERLTEDGTMRKSSTCTSEYNAWERCVIMWGEDPKKYSTPESRRLCLDKELKFAHAKAETKAFVKTIRELAYMPTGYKQEELKEGRMFFAKVRRSRAVLKAETAARLSALSRGVLPQPVEQERIENKIIDITPTESAVSVGSFDISPANEELDIKSLPPVERLIYVFEKYIETNFIPSGIGPDGKTLWTNLVSGMTKWLKETPEADTLSTKKISWEKAIANLESLEKQIPELGRVRHDLY